MTKRNIHAEGLYHIYNRGTKKEAIFIAKEDYERFLNKLFLYASETKDKIINYCLLPNHFHLMIKAFDEKSVSKLMLRLKTSHAKHICNKYKFVGHIFQGRFDSVHISSDNHIKIASRYIHRNPIEFFGDCEVLEKYPWSSYQNYKEKGKDEYFTKDVKDTVLSLFNNPQEYIDFVRADEIYTQRKIKEDVIAFTKGAI